MPDTTVGDSSAILVGNPGTHWRRELSNRNTRQDKLVNLNFLVATFKKKSSKTGEINFKTVFHLTH